MNIDPIENAFEELENNIMSDDLESFQQALVDRLGDHGADRSNYTERIFELFEKYPDAYWGEPGTVVHYLESLDNDVYEKELIASIERCPVDLTLWLLNRECNSKKTKGEIEKYCDIFKRVVQKNELSSNVIDSAEHFLNYQNKRIAQIDNAADAAGHRSQNNAMNDLLEFKPK